MVLLILFERVNKVMFLVLLEDIPTLAGSNLIASICTNVANTVKAVGSYIILLMGLVLIIMAVIQIAKGFVSGKAQWLITLGGLLFGGLLIFGGWSIITGSFGGWYDAYSGDGVE